MSQIKKNKATFVQKHIVLKCTELRLQLNSQKKVQERVSTSELTEIRA